MRRLICFGLAVVLTDATAVADAACPRGLEDALSRAAPGFSARRELSILDAGGNLAHFYGALRELAAGRRKKVRIAFYGDSNNSMDWASGALRSRLARAFGFAGHGFVAAGQPHPWYQHNEISVRHTKGRWIVKATSTPRYKKPYYGHHGILGKGVAAGGYVEYFPQKKGDPANRSFSRFTVHYLCGPGLGSFGVSVDARPVGKISARCNTISHRTVTYTVPLGQHKVRLTTRRAPIYVLGTSFERKDSAGIVVDGLGVGALNLARLAAIEEKQFIAGHRARKYDLVIIHTGTNMWAAKRNHAKWAATFIRRIRAALGNDVSILMLPPPDFAKRQAGILRSHTRMRAAGREKKEIAAIEHIAFWDYYKSMGGLGSIMAWKRKGMVAGDYIHLKERLHKIMMARLATALLQGARKYWAANGLDCKIRPKVPLLAAAGPAGPGPGAATASRVAIPLPVRAERPPVPLPVRKTDMLETVRAGGSADEPGVRAVAKALPHDHEG